MCRNAHKRASPAEISGRYVYTLNRPDLRPVVQNKECTHTLRAHLVNNRLPFLLPNERNAYKSTITEPLAEWNRQTKMIAHVLISCLLYQNIAAFATTFSTFSNYRGTRLGNPIGGLTADGALECCIRCYVHSNCTAVSFNEGEIYFIYQL